MKKTILITTIILLAAITQAQVEDGSFMFEGDLRTYKVLLPQDYEAGMPVVFNLHGYPDNALWQMQYSAMNEVADTAGFIVVYPNAASPGFYTGVYKEGWPPILKKNDVGFISVLIDTLADHYNIDMSRIYCCGYSNGGHMTLKLAGQLGHRFAAFATVAGPMIDSIYNHSHPLRPFPLLLCHGTADKVVPYNGNSWSGDWSVEETLALLVEHNNCIQEPDTLFLPDLDPDDGSTVQKISWNDCSDETAVLFYKILDGGHTWPGGHPTITFSSEGNKNWDININAEIWNFFKNYENPLVNMAWGQGLEASPGYLDPTDDTLHVKARLVNNADHPVTTKAYIRGVFSDFCDSLQLYDDGLHDDGEGADDLFANKLPLTGLEEDRFTVELSVYDETEEIRQDFHWPSEYTTIGPLILEKSEFTEADTLPQPNDRLRLYLTLRNNGQTVTACNITARLKSLDPRVQVYSEEQAYPDLASGETAVCEDYYRMNIAEDCPVNSDIFFTLEIASDNYIFWYDTFSIHVYEPPVEALPKQAEVNVSIYPNPAKNEIHIHFDKDLQEDALIELYNTGGRLLRRKRLPAGHPAEYSMCIAALTKGIYFIRINTRSFTTIKKMVRVE